jgi:outer membrane receptor for ferric coprogen and ferric-rhodotorulic acid
LTVTAAGTTAGLELSPTQVTANQLGNVTENTGSYTPGSIATATRLVLTPKETPQSVTVVTRQHMDDFGLNNVDDVMRHTPGITVSAFDTERSNYYARGFSINNFQYDGIPSTARNVAYSAGNTLSDMAIYDRVEVLMRAPLACSLAPAPWVRPSTLCAKSPPREFQGHASAGVGSWDNYRSELDVSGPLTETGNVRVGRWRLTRTSIPSWTAMSVKARSTTHHGIRPNPGHPLTGDYRTACQRLVLVGQFR